MKIVIPGEILGTTEEYIAGEGTIEENGNIISVSTGELHIDDDRMSITVKYPGQWPELEVGVEVYGQIANMFEEFAIVKVLKMDNMEREIIDGTQMASLHISQISNEFVDSIKKTIRIGDIVRAKVIQGRPTLRLSIQDVHHGVVSGHCINCRAILVKKDGNLYCEKCEHIEYRKIADDYGNVTF